MPNQSKELTDVEKKVAYALGHEVDGQTLVEKLIARWKAYIMLRRFRLSKFPLHVILRSFRDHEETES
jgi:hypothetical protein